MDKRKNPIRSHRSVRFALTLVCAAELSRLSAFATEFEPLGKAVASTLGTKSAFKKSFAFEKKPLDVFYAKDAGGKASKYAFIQKGVYEPNCTHTWVVGVDAKSGKVTDVRVVEMSCPHAYPTKTEGFLGQFKGKSFKDAEKLKSDVMPIAKATGSANLAIDAVRKSLLAASKLKGKI
jgi:NifU-like protein involved in Fe-S cluster formation